MKKIYIVVLLFLVLALTIYFIGFSNNKNGSVLGSSVNNFYLEKTVKIYQNPTKDPTSVDPRIYADSVVLIDAKTKYPLYVKNPEKPVPIASITKIMTAIITLDKFELDEIVEIKKDQTEVIGSKVFLKEGEKITVENLLYCLLMSSGNDAAKTLATFKTSQEEFIKAMNEKAKELGLKNTEFKDPAGLDDTGHSSARDIAILFSYGLSRNDFTKIVSTSEKTVTSVDGSEIHELKNSNRLTTGEIPMDGIIGGKTGFTPDAGHTLVSAAEKDSNRIVGVVLNTLNSTVSASAEEMKKLLEWGFQSYTFNQP
ncbi:MAG: D-alanyl-D-alanine carboxypeptidase family protein [bacterium]